MSHNNHPTSACLLGSLRSHPKGAVLVGKPAAEELLHLTLILKRNADLPETHSILPYEHFVEHHGMSGHSIDAVDAFVAAHGLSLVSEHRPSRTVVVAGPLGKLADLFGADLALHQIDGQTVRTRQGSLHLPKELEGHVVAVLGFDQRASARTRHRVLPRSANGSFTPPQLARLYNFPAGTGKGQTIAFIELGGGYSASDLKSYWRKMGVPAVSTTAIGVAGAHNTPTGDVNGPDGEVLLDLEVAGALAPGAKQVVYFGPNTDAGFLAAINAAIHDHKRKPGVISISWGGPESNWTAQAMQVFHDAFADAGALGISVTVAAGDNGSSDGVSDDQAHVDFPASSPWVMACGGTRLVGASTGQILSETVWHDDDNSGATGGGISSFFKKPPYQSQLAIAGRGVPDVAGCADPETGYEVLVDGQWTVVGGTSAVAPLWAALIAILNENLGWNVGSLHTLVYNTPGILHDITEGNNGAFQAGPGWDPCTGFGTPDGKAILAALKK